LVAVLKRVFRMSSPWNDCLIHLDGDPAEGQFELRQELRHGRPAGDLARLAVDEHIHGG